MINGFEWNQGKAASNIKKHGVSFDEAVTVFWDENALIINDPDHSEDEDCFILLGMSENLRILVVIHCERGNTIRLISARTATKQERKQYEAHL
ncbi:MULTISPECIES: BrnT family toxin [unclassified Snodgrassella]|uniref:BrnT family toxin n=1 Tax=unclassified Snodgrassella TaxID=2625236 RepID=UPI0018DB166C|nr:MULTISPECIES: BrnT family toxin [unclassified Snodgrassella]MBI0159417.1 BrnT family toxin [Snodgrassella sp. W6238H11]MBI0161415.1 BrnT family toxin [Snodgrassella sp. W6238H14]